MFTIILLLLGGKMNVYRESITLKTQTRGTIEITEQIQQMVYCANIKTGLCHIFLAHTSASLILCENADPSVRQDLEAFVSQWIKDDAALFLHNEEGDDDMPAHLRTIFTQNSLTIPIEENKLILGTWQGIYLWEHRKQPQQRNLTITIF
ncbi:MAG: secondary thiamine-phosphate synthase enzyme [Gammaproteobacteria bacterium]|jgi:secondary thiamine-phosphate synthase enzyme|nr:secondary thiamine-phosphate synthase enzyme [Gammaproteobacteria bacterium]